MLQEGDVVWIPLPWETRPTIKSEGGTQSQDWSVGGMGRGTPPLTPHPSRREPWQPDRGLELTRLLERRRG